MKLSSPVTFNKHVQPVCVTSSSLEFKNRNDCWVTGWGNIGERQSEAGDRRGGGGEHCPPGPVPAHTAAAGAPPRSVPTLPSLCPPQQSALTPSPPPPRSSAFCTHTQLPLPSGGFEPGARDQGPPAQTCSPRLQGCARFWGALIRKALGFFFFWRYCSQSIKIILLKCTIQGLPWWWWLRLCPSTAGGHGFNPWLGN